MGGAEGVRSYAPVHVLATEVSTPDLPRSLPVPLTALLPPTCRNKSDKQVCATKSKL